MAHGTGTAAAQALAGHESSETTARHTQRAPSTRALGDAMMRVLGGDPLAGDLVAVLKGVLGGHCLDQVFWHGKGSAEAYRDVKRSFKTALRRAGISHFRFHDCRHHLSSWFVMDGGNILHLQKILGHESVQMTELYAHLSPDFIEAAARVLDGHSGGSWTHSGHTAVEGRNRKRCKWLESWCAV